MKSFEAVYWVSILFVYKSVAMLFILNLSLFMDLFTSNPR